MTELEREAEEKVILEKLSNMPLFGAFYDHHLKAMLKMSALREFERFEPIFKEGQFDNRIYVLLSGSVNVVKNGEVVSTLRRAGDLFGEMCIIDGSPRSATIYAVGKARCLVIDGSFIDNVDDKDKEAFLGILYKGFVDILTGRLRATTDELSQAKDKIAMLKDELSWERDRLRRASN